MDGRIGGIMTCKRWILFQEGSLSAADFKAHAASCPACQAQALWDEALGQALVAPAAPADVVEQVLAQTTRRQSAWARWRAVLVGGVVALVIAVGTGVRMIQPSPFTNTELVAYMSQSTQDDEYATFLSDLDLLETL